MSHHPNAIGAVMEELAEIINKYDESYISENLGSLEELNRFAFTFYKDVAEIYDCVTRIKNVERNPSGYSLSDAPILGLLVRVWKLLKEIIEYYEKENAEIIGILERPLIEAAVTAHYLLRNDDAVIEDYRKCSYKDRLRILRELSEGSRFFETKAAKRLLRSVEEKMSLEGFTENDFKTQKSNRWKLQGKSFFDIFSEVTSEDLYKYTYGIMSESVHGSWNESMDWCLQKNDDESFSVFPFYHQPDIRYVSPTLTFCNTPYRLWLERIEAYEDNLKEVFDWIERVNNRIFIMFDQRYDGTV
jgi:hypothetical protein